MNISVRPGHQYVHTTCQEKLTGVTHCSQVRCPSRTCAGSASSPCAHNGWQVRGYMHQAHHVHNRMHHQQEVTVQFLACKLMPVVKVVSRRLLLGVWPHLRFLVAKAWAAAVRTTFQYGSSSAALRMLCVLGYVICTRVLPGGLRSSCSNLQLISNNCGECR
jgi:hypothetical protein